MTLFLSPAATEIIRSKSQDIINIKMGCICYCIVCLLIEIVRHIL